MLDQRGAVRCVRAVQPVQQGAASSCTPFPQQPLSAALVQNQRISAGGGSSP